MRYGYDADVNTGFLKVATLSRDIVITSYADGQHDPTLIVNF